MALCLRTDFVDMIIVVLICDSVPAAEGRGLTLTMCETTRLARPSCSNFAQAALVHVAWL